MSRASCIAGGWAVGITSVPTLWALWKGFIWLVESDHDPLDWFFSSEIALGVTPAGLVILATISWALGYSAYESCLKRKARRRSGP